MRSPINDHPGQLKIWKDPARFKVVSAGRRFGKTKYLQEKLAFYTNTYAWKTAKPSVSFYMAPTRGQAKEIMWEGLKDTFRFYKWKFDKNESELILIRSINKAKIKILSGESYERARGGEYDYGSIDEVADVPSDAWTKVIRPSLSDRKGDCDFFGTPKGKNWFFDLYSEAKTRKDWKNFSFKTVDSPFFQTPEGLQELEDAKRDLDEKTYRQEYEASFESYGGTILSSFKREVNCSTHTVNPNMPIYIGQDFNVGFMASVFFQHTNDGFVACDELILKDSNTEMVCREISRRYPHTRIVFRPDATGSARKPSATRTDHQIIRDFGFEVESPIRNPYKVDRWAAVNRALEQGKVKINPKTCKQTIREVESLSYKDGTCEASVNLTTGHLHDAFCYPIFREFPILVRKPTVVHKYA